MRTKSACEISLEWQARKAITADGEQGHGLLLRALSWKLSRSGSFPRLLPRATCGDSEGMAGNQIADPAFPGCVRRSFSRSAGRDDAARANGLRFRRRARWRAAV